MTRKSCIALLFWLMLVTFLSACEPRQQFVQLQYSDHAPATESPVYRFAVHPLHNPKRLSAVYQPLMDHINANVRGFQMELEASRDYQAFEAKYEARSPEFLLPNPWQTLQAMPRGYHVIAMAGDAQDFKGIFLVRKDSSIVKPADLKGKVVSYPSHTALAAAVMPQYYLHTHGMKLGKDVESIYVGSQEASILNVYLGKVAAGATWPPPWRLFQQDHPKEAAQLKVVWETEPLVNNAVMVRDDVPEAARAQVQKILLGLHESGNGTSVLAGMETSRFHSANDANYDTVVRYVRRFEAEVRPVLQP